MHKVTIIGNVGSEPKVRFTPNGLKVASFTIASHRKRQNGDKVTTWFKVSGWNGLTEVIEKWVKVGRKLYIECVLEPTPHAWIDEQTGKPRSMYQGSIREMHFLDAGKVDEMPDGAQEHDSDGNPIGTPADEDNIPF